MEATRSGNSGDVQACLVNSDLRTFRLHVSMYVYVYLCNTYNVIRIRYRAKCLVALRLVAGGLRLVIIILVGGLGVFGFLADFDLRI